MSSARVIWATLGVLILLVVVFSRLYGARVDALFDRHMDVTAAVPIESFSRARAGKPVRVTPAALPVTYEVKRGDSWASIARAHRIDDYNALAGYFDFMPLRPGMTLTIPAHLLEGP